MSLDTRVSSTPSGSVTTTEPSGAGRLARRLWSKGHIPGEVGIWIFIFGDMTLYGLLFCSFIHDRAKHPALFNASAKALHTSFGAANTLLLLTSSLCVALGIRAVREQIVPQRAKWLFSVALLCSFGFVVNKVLEYSDLISTHHYPDKNVFFTYYFVLTGIHLTHLLAGSGVLIFLRKMSLKKVWIARDISAMESGASFWHVVDLLWIVLFPLLYLVR